MQLKKRCASDKGNDFFFTGAMDAQPVAGSVLLRYKEVVQAIDFLSASAAFHAVLLSLTFFMERGLYYKNRLMQRKT